MEKPRPDEIPPELLDADTLAEESLAHAGGVREATPKDFNEATKQLRPEVEADIKRLETEVGLPDTQSDDGDLNTETTP